MNNENLDEEDILTTSTDTDETTVNTHESYGDESEDEDDVETLKAKLEKAQRDYNNQKIRAEKAEAQAKAKPAERTETSKQSNSKGLSPFDLMAVAKADLDEEGLAEVMDFASYKKISIAEALKSPVIKATLAEKAENKRIAEATNTGNSRRGSSKVSDDALLDGARSGKLPDSDYDLKRLIEARMKRR